MPAHESGEQLEKLAPYSHSSQRGHLTVPRESDDSDYAVGVVEKVIASLKSFVGPLLQFLAFDVGLSFVPQNFLSWIRRSKLEIGRFEPSVSDYYTRRFLSCNSSRTFKSMTGSCRGLSLG